MTVIYTEPKLIDRDETIAILKAELKARSGKAWSVTGGRGTGWGWIRVVAPPRRRDGSTMSAEDSAELAKLFRLDHAHHQGVSIPASSAHRREYIARSRGGIHHSTSVLGLTAAIRNLIQGRALGAVSPPDRAALTRRPVPTA